MSDRPIIYLSTVSTEHGSLRTAVAGLLQELGFDTCFFEVTAHAHRHAGTILAWHVAQCDGLLQLTGHRYGFAPPELHPQFGPCSHAQFEALHARSLGMKVWHLLLDPSHPHDPCEPELPALQALQAEYRLSLGAQACATSATPAETLLRIREWRGAFDALRADRPARLERERMAGRSLRPILLGLLAILLLLAAAAYSAIRWHRGADGTQGPAHPAAGPDAGMNTTLMVFMEAQADMAREITPEGRTLTDCTEAELLADYAQRTRLDPATVRSTLDAALASNDPSARAKALLITGRFADAAKLFREAADAGAAQLKVTMSRTPAFIEKTAQDYRREALAHSYQLHFLPAITACESALRHVTQASHPALWAQLQHDLALALHEHAIRADPAIGNAFLDRAATALRSALAVLASDTSPEKWAAAQYTLGNTLWVRGQRATGGAAQELVGQAVAAYQAALTIHTRQNHPLEWAAAQNNLGPALRHLGSHMAGTAGAIRISQATAACRAALTVFTRERTPHQWATAQNNLGAALTTQAESAGEVGVQQRLLREAEAAYLAASEVFAGDASGEHSAVIRDNLAHVRAKLGK